MSAYYIHTSRYWHDIMMACILPVVSDDFVDGGHQRRLGDGCLINGDSDGPIDHESRLANGVPAERDGDDGYAVVLGLVEPVVAAVKDEQTHFGVA